MFENLAQWAMIAILVIVVLLAVFAVFELARLRTRFAKLLEAYEQQQTMVLKLQGALKAIGASAAEQSRLQDEVRQALERLRDQHDALATRGPESARYEQAIRLAEGGTSRAEIKRVCQLSEAELDLILRLHPTNR